MYCVHCGQQIPDTAKFCPFCGGMNEAPAPGPAAGAITETAPAFAAAPETPAPAAPEAEGSAPAPAGVFTLTEEGTVQSSSEPEPLRTNVYALSEAGDVVQEGTEAPTLIYEPEAPAEAPAKKPFLKRIRWWGWLIIGFVAFEIILFTILGLCGVFKKTGTEPATEVSSPAVISEAEAEEPVTGAMLMPLPDLGDDVEIPTPGAGEMLFIAVNEDCSDMERLISCFLYAPADFEIREFSLRAEGLEGTNASAVTNTYQVLDWAPDSAFAVGDSNFYYLDVDADSWFACAGLEYVYQDFNTEETISFGDCDLFYDCYIDNYHGSEAETAMAAEEAEPAETMGEEEMAELFAELCRTPGERVEKAYAEVMEQIEAAGMEEEWSDLCCRASLYADSLGNMNADRRELLLDLSESYGMYGRWDYVRGDCAAAFEALSEGTCSQAFFDLFYRDDTGLLYLTDIPVWTQAHLTEYLAAGGETEVKPGKPMTGHYLLVDTSDTIDIDNSSECFYPMTDDYASEIRDRAQEVNDYIQLYDTDAILQTASPDNAAVIIYMNVEFSSRGTYSSGSGSATVYATILHLDAVNTLTGETASFTLANEPGSSISGSVGARVIWKNIPEIGGDEGFRSFMDTVIGWGRA